MRNQDRLSSLDLIRGVAILGILPANLAAFSGPVGGGPSPLDRAAEAMILLFISMKMMSTLSMLFGAGLALQFDSARRRDDFPERYLWRQLLLLALGVLHGVVLWFGDILASYACVGSVALVLLLLGSGWMRGAAIVGLGWFYFVTLVFLLLCLLFPDLGKQETVIAPDGPPLPLFSERGLEGVQDYLSEGNQTRIHREGTILQRLALRAVLFSVILLTMPFLFGWYVLACFLIGAGLARAGFFRDRQARRPYARLFLVLGLGIGLPLHLLAASIQWAYPGWALPAPLNMLGALPQALMYLALLAAWDASGELPWIAERFRAVGRMALTNYLMQTVLMVAAFDGMGWYGRMGAASGMGLVAAVWLLELTWSKPWLERFKTGPVEWAWRKLLWKGE